ncbi:hypothetical protein [Pseudomonas sp. OTU750018]|uniref:hypothetical protein n=1 Tax=Pseudomonas sp. OTU750018 TaxID=2709708 RepID=UPI001420F7B6|nr:hypothetical protein [Pseudomonas sp. OTU750018]
MEELRFAETRSMKSLFRNMDEQWYEIQSGFLRHLNRWQEIAKDLGQNFEVIDEPSRHGKGTIFGKEYVVKLGLTVRSPSSPEALGIIRVVANHAVSGEALEVESYLMTQGLNFFSTGNMTPIVMDNSVRAEYQIICESIYAVAASSDV